MVLATRSPTTLIPAISITFQRGTRDSLWILLHVNFLWGKLPLRAREDIDDVSEYR